MRMINTLKFASKFAFVAAVALASVAPPALAQSSRTVHHRHVYNYAPGQRAYDYVPNAGTSNTGTVDKPVDNPVTTGGGSMGYNQCAGHPSC